MDFTNLKQLHLDMLEKEIEHQLIRAKIGATAFEILFATGDSFRPFLALAAGTGPSPTAFRFEVQRGYKIDAYLGDRYADARDLWFGRGKTTRKLQAKDFFEALHAVIPTAADPALVPTGAQIARILGPEQP